jgi:hypothetical protein
MLCTVPVFLLAAINSTALPAMVDAQVRASAKTL